MDLECNELVELTCWIRSRQGARNRKDVNANAAGAKTTASNLVCPTGNLRAACALRVTCVKNLVINRRSEQLLAVTPASPPRPNSPSMTSGHYNCKTAPSPIFKPRELTLQTCSFLNNHANLKTASPNHLACKDVKLLAPNIVPMMTCLNRATNPRLLACSPARPILVSVVVSRFRGPERGLTAAWVRFRP